MMIVNNDEAGRCNEGMRGRYYSLASFVFEVGT